jgi:hypothetical protein
VQRESERGRVGHHHRGNPPRRRNHSDAVRTGASAPQQLPRNCYAASWLNTLRPWEKFDLKMDECDYDFSQDLLQTGSAPGQR